jgi:hypothetical protein
MDAVKAAKLRELGRMVRGRALTLYLDLRSDSRRQRWVEGYYCTPSIV